jgi:deazaflavin-dependent oxidoreductase (nitroreductase family)
VPSITDRFLGIAGKAHTSVFRASRGKVGGRMLGSEVLLLNTVGRKSGQKRTTPLLYLRDGDEYVIVASKGGSQTHPAWYHNLKANPETTIEVGDRKIPVRAGEANPEEKARLWPKLVEMYPSYESYQRKTEREIPVIILEPAG